MKARKTILVSALILVFGSGIRAQAATQNFPAYLTITNVAPAYASITGSWFAMDSNSDGMIEKSEKTGITGAGYGSWPGTLILGTTQTAGTFDTWSFFGYTGTDYTTLAPTGDATSGIDLSGWGFTWNGFSKRWEAAPGSR